MDWPLILIAGLNLILLLVFLALNRIAKTLRSMALMQAASLSPQAADTYSKHVRS